jgi:hypothetical protein
MLPKDFGEISKNTTVVNRAKSNRSIILYGENAAPVTLQLADKNFMFYGHQVANCFGLKHPTRLLLNFNSQNNVFRVMALGDIDSEESGTNPTNPDIIEIQSSDDEKCNNPFFKGLERQYIFFFF